MEDEQECARLASNKTVGLFWTFDKNQKICHMKNTDGQKRPLKGWVTGNRECGLLDQTQWEQLVKEKIILSPEIRQEMMSYLTSVNCQDNPEETGSTGREQLPIIDLFLNPNRSNELKETLKESEKREGGVTHTKVICDFLVINIQFQDDLSQAYPNLFRLLWKSTLACHPSTTFSDSAYILKKCWWQGRQVQCSEIFTPVITDSGVCCAFNLETNFMESNYSKLVKEMQVRERFK